MSDSTPIYLDNAASTLPHPALIEALPQLVAEAAVNPASGHALGNRLRERLSRARDQFLADLDIDQANVVWTSGATEANNLAIYGLLAELGDQAVCVSPATEHASVRAPLAVFAPELRPLPVTATGAIDFAALADCLDRRVRLVSITATHNETGVIPDLIRLRRCLDQLAPRARLHVDASQALGKLSIPWRAARIDLLAATGHKIHGPGGVGCLIVRDQTQLAPMIHGGGQQGGLRSGTLDGVGILGFCHAITLAQESREANHRHVTSLAQRLWFRLAAAALPEWQRLSPDTPERHSPYVCSFSLPGYQAAVIVRMLGERGVMVASGSACAAESAAPSHALTAMGLSPPVARGALRVSFCPDNTSADVDAFVDNLVDVIQNW